MNFDNLFLTEPYHSPTASLVWMVQAADAPPGRRTPDILDRMDRGGPVQ